MTNRTRWPAILLGYLAIFTTAAHACLWDTDTLKAEAAGLPGVVEIITGRFDRFPPLYYEMRLERVTQEVESRPDELELYDDAGVALDRLGRSGEAIAWMARKLEAIERIEAAGADVGEHRYRYLANLGTFHVHRWLKGGADRADMADVERARELIAAAIELNPDAHFGRERYQLLAIDWLLEPPPMTARGYPSIWRAAPQAEQFSFGSGDMDWYQKETGQSVLEAAGYSDSVEGLSGLISLGAAWESIDIFAALAAVLDDRSHASLAYLVRMRIEELAADGATALHPDADDFSGFEFWYGDAGSTDQNANWFREARSEADQWSQSRIAYVNRRLNRGEHPDTHPEFWGAWIETSSAPSLPGQVDPKTMQYIVGGVLIVVALVVLATADSLRRKREANSAAI